MPANEPSPSTVLGEHTSADGLKSAMTAAWDHGAARYDSNWGHGLQTTVEREAWTALLDRLVPPSPVLRILDVGTGTGFFALLLSELGHDVTGLDLSECMLSVARSKAEEQGLSPTFLLGDADSPPPLGQFDLVVARHVLWTLPRPEAAVRAWAGLVCPGGRVMAVDGMWGSDRLLDRALATAGRALGQLQSGGHDGDHTFPSAAQGRLPLRHVRSMEPARNVFVRAELTEVLAEELTWIDEIERSVMPLAQRLEHRHRRYLLEGRRAG